VCQMGNTLFMSMSTSKPEIGKNQYETASWKSGSVICGVDEVGRGCLAGPVVTAAVVLYPNPPEDQLVQLRDSKTMNAQELTNVAEWVLANSWYGYGIVEHTRIDTHNIYQATLIAMKRAVVQALCTCPQLPDTIVVDAMPLQLAHTGFAEIPVHNFPKAESLSASVAAASIIAKVKRDILMRQLDTVIPGYQFTTHKGYATGLHCNALENQGKSIIHRESFLGFMERQHAQQQTIC
jgi:ribonuclease HII